MAPKGTHTREGQIVGFEVGPGPAAVLACEGVVDACLAEDGEMVGFGAALFRLGRRLNAGCEIVLLRQPMDTSTSAASRLRAMRS